MRNHARAFEANRRAWDLRTPYHAASAFYDVPGFKAGATSLRAVELAELGDVRGKSLLHMMCHFGLDTMSLARLGARATGIDFSEKAIALARALAGELGLDVRFLRGNVYDTRMRVRDRFDIVFTSYGVLGWLPDLGRWGRIISSSLKPGGTFYMVEFHPFVWMLDDAHERIAYGYFHSDEPLAFDIAGTYADRRAPIAYRDFNWAHTLGDVVNALVASGLEIAFLHEFPYSAYDCLPGLEKAGEEKWVFKGLGDRIPYMFSVKARKL